MSHPSTPSPHATAIAAFVTFFEQLKPEDLARLDRFYTEDAFFKDPFNEVRGLAAIRAIFAHMFDSLEAPRFRVLDVVAQDAQCFLTWDFDFALRGRPQRIHGASHLRLAEDGRVAYHCDYWDAAEQLWEKVPLLGAVLRWLRGRLRVQT